MTEHVMIDIETMGTERDAVILSIGAVKFDRQEIHEDTGFYENLDWQDQIDSGGTVTEGTIRFWLKQPASAREALFNKKGKPPLAVISELKTWFAGNIQNPKRCNVWSKGPAFDLVLIRDLCFRLDKIEVPWPFWAERCVRTALMMPGVDTIKPSEDMVQHHAFHDAVHRAKQVRKFLIACGGPALRPKTGATKKPKNEPIDDDLLS